MISRKMLAACCPLILILPSFNVWSLHSIILVASTEMRVLKLIACKMIIYYVLIPYILNHYRCPTKKHRVIPTQAERLAYLLNFLLLETCHHSLKSLFNLSHSEVISLHHALSLMSKLFTEVRLTINFFLIPL